MSVLEKLKPLLAQSTLFQVAADEQLRKNKWKSNRKRFRDADRYTASGDFMAPKIGQGGTLDPLADGVLVIGIGAGTKQLQQFLHCTKEYKTVGLLGSSTLSYDADEPILHRKPFAHVNADTIRNILPSFRGKFQQLPPLYSAIRIDGKRLFDYAREGLDLPRPIERRDVEITNLQLVEWHEGGEHSYKEPERECDETERQVAMRARKLAGLDGDKGTGEVESRTDEIKVQESTTGQEGEQAVAQPGDPAEPITESQAGNAISPPTFTLQMTVSSGTYVRSVVHDVGAQAKSAAHVVRLSRTRQGDWISPEYPVKEGDDPSKLRKAIGWEVLQRAADELASKTKRTKLESADAPGVERQGDGGDEPAEWERLVLAHMQVITL